jgi:hypothetical protein
VDACSQGQPAEAGCLGMDTILIASLSTDQYAFYLQFILGSSRQRGFDAAWLAASNLTASEFWGDSPQSHLISTDFGHFYLFWVRI